MRKIYRFLRSLIYRYRCFIHGFKYKKGVRIRKGVKRDRDTTVVLSENCWIGANTNFWGGGTVKLGKNTHFGANTSIYASKEGGVTFGDNVNCARNLFVIDSSHGYDKKDELICKQPMTSEPIFIGDNCWIGVNCTFIKGASIGNGCVVGACSLVNKKFDNDLVIAGTPAKVLKNR